MLTKRGSGDERQTVAFIAAPPEVRGVAFLQVERAGRDTEQWLYLPEFRRTRQISTRLRDESFVGTDLSYRDLDIISRFLRWTEADAPSRLIGEDSIDGLACQRIELKPQLDELSYSLIVVWLDKETLVPRRMDLIGSDGQVAKQIRFADVRDVGRVPTAHRIEVKNMVRGSQTIVEIQHVDYDQSLADELFTQRQLERGAP